MLGMAILDVAIGVLFVFVLLSLVCSALSEWITNFLRRRSESLRQGIRTLLGGDEDGGLTDVFFKHPLIAGLRTETLRGDADPTWIPAPTFALALMDVADPRSADQTAGDAVGEAGTAVKNLRAALVTEAAKENGGQVRKALVPIIDAAEGSMTRLREGVERWYKDAEKQMTEWYRRRSQIVVAILAAIVCVGFNVDTVMITDTLSKDAALRTSLVAAAEAAVEQPLERSGDPETVVRSIKAEVETLGFPLGWTRAPDDPRNPPDDIPGWLKKIAGLFLSVVAVSLGAPFWFDVLKKLVALKRGVVSEAPAARRKDDE